MKIVSKAFSKSGPIPTRYTGEGEDISPPLDWSDVPERCRSFALLCDDPDAPGRSLEYPFCHWIIFNIPSDVRGLPEGIPPVGQVQIPVSAIQGKNSFGEIGYSGPLPPRGTGVHRYLFRLYALDTELEFGPGVERAPVLAAMTGHILDTAELVGTYEYGRRAQAG